MNNPFCHPGNRLLSVVDLPTTFPEAARLLRFAIPVLFSWSQTLSTFPRDFTSLPCRHVPHHVHAQLPTSKAASLCLDLVIVPRIDLFPSPTLPSNSINAPMQLFLSFTMKMTIRFMRNCPVPTSLLVERPKFLPTFVADPFLAILRDYLVTMS